MTSVKAMRLLCLFVFLNLSIYSSTNGFLVIEADDNVRKQMLDLHNGIRAKHSSPPLALDANLNKQAQRCAKYYANVDKLDETCPYRQDFGENLFQVRNVEDKTTIEDVLQITMKWWYENQKDNYDYATGNPKDEKKKYLAFTQVVWSDTTKLGVGTVRTNTTVYVTTLYDPPGNIDNQFTTNVKKPK